MICRCSSISPVRRGGGIRHALAFEPHAAHLIAANPAEREHVEALSTALATFGKAAREAIDEAERFGDADTADVFTKISRETDKQLWLVEAHLHS